jgi:hypothetical protein
MVFIYIRTQIGIYFMKYQDYHATVGLFQAKVIVLICKLD